MRAVQFRNLFGGEWSLFAAWQDEFDEFFNDLVSGVHATSVEAVAIRYDNGQLCTFRRKPAKQEEGGE